MPLLPYASAFLIAITTPITTAEDTDETHYLRDSDFVQGDLGLDDLFSTHYDPDINCDLPSLRNYLSTVKGAASCSQREDVARNHMGRIHWNKAFKATVSTVLNARIDAIIDENQLHPKQHLAASKTDKFPATDVMASSALAAVTRDLFGDVAMNGHYPDADLINPIRTILNHNFTRLRRAFDRANLKVGPLRENMKRAMAGVVGPNVALTDVEAAIEATRIMEKMSSWHPNIQIEVNANLGELYALLRAALPEANSEPPLDVQHIPVKSSQPRAALQVRTAGRRGASSKLTSADLSKLPEIHRALELVRRHLEHDYDQDVGLHHPIESAVLHGANGEDQGVLTYASMSTASLCSHLAFQEAQPPMFSRFRRLDGTTAWDVDEHQRQAWEVGGQGFERLSLMWHQLVGVASLVDLMWSSEAVDASEAVFPGAILADGVGLGKTAQVMATIAFVLQVYHAQEIKAPYPPAIANRPYFAGRQLIECSPHLIIVPLTLLSQWRQELRAFFRQGIIDIFVLPTSAADVDAFFRGGAWTKSHAKLIHRIVLASSSTIGNLASTAFRTPQGNTRAPPEQKRPFIFGALPTVFERTWSTVWVDEAHLLRGTATKGFLGVCALRHQAAILNCITATPLHSGIKDVFSVARMIGHPNFCGLPGVSFLSRLDGPIKAARRKLSLEEKAKKATSDIHFLQGKEVTAKGRYIAEELERVTETAVESIRQSLGSRLIRRTTESKRGDGATILAERPPLHNVVVPIKLEKREKRVLEGIAEGMVMDRNDSLVPFTNENFWIDYRVNISCYKPDGKTWPIFDKDGMYNGEPFDAVASTKLRTLVSMLSHLLGDDANDPPVVDSDQLKFPRTTNTSSSSVPSRTRKVLVYHEWTMMDDTIVSAFAAYNIPVLVLNGAMSLKKRSEIVASFRRNKHPAARVLLFSSVGGVGLNLECANIVILMDAVWSHVDSEQIIGRSYRLTQTLPVHVYNLVALGTTDVLMASLAHDKSRMAKQLLDGAVDQHTGTLKTLLSPVGAEATVDTPDDEDPHDALPSAAKTREAKHTANQVSKEKAKMAHIDRGRVPAGSPSSSDPEAYLNGPRRRIFKRGGKSLRKRPKNVPFFKDIVLHAPISTTKHQRQRPPPHPKPTSPLPVGRKRSSTLTVPWSPSSRRTNKRPRHKLTYEDHEESDGKLLTGQRRALVGPSTSTSATPYESDIEMSDDHPDQEDITLDLPAPTPFVDDPHAPDLEVLRRLALEDLDYDADNDISTMEEQCCASDGLLERPDDYQKHESIEYKDC